MADTPLPFTCHHEVYTAGAKDGNGNPKPGWAPPVPRECFWWDPDSTEPVQGPTGGQNVIADRVLVIDAAVAVDHRDRFAMGTTKFTVDGLPKDYNHGPFGYNPNRIIVALKKVG